jgi:hypothetical protein
MGDFRESSGRSKAAAAPDPPIDGTPSARVGALAILVASRTRQATLPRRCSQT